MLSLFSFRRFSAVGLCVMTIVVGGVVGCASEPKLSSYQETFEPKVFENGLKLFSYTLVYRPAIQGPRGSADPERASRSEKKKQQRRLQRAIHYQLEQRLSMSGFCREGYLVLDELFDRGRAKIRGECRDGASDDDRRRFSG